MSVSTSTQRYDHIVEISKWLHIPPDSRKISTISRSLILPDTVTCQLLWRQSKCCAMKTALYCTRQVCTFYIYGMWTVWEWNKFTKTKSYGGLWPPTSSSCGGWVAFIHLEGLWALLSFMSLVGPLGLP